MSDRDRDFIREVDEAVRQDRYKKLWDQYGIYALAAAVVFTWLYQNSAESVLPAILMHASHQNSVRFLRRVFEGGDAIQHQWIGLVLWLAIAVAIVAIYGTDSFRHRDATAVAG